MKSSTNSERWLAYGIVAMLLVTGVLSWKLHMSSRLEVDVAPLSQIPLQIGPWKGRDQPIRAGVAKMLNADFNLQRFYQHPVEGTVWLYLGYFGTERGGRPEHTPWICYPSSGWKIESKEIVDLEIGGSGRANEIVISKGGERRLVHFWYQSYRRTGMVGDFDQIWERLSNRILEGRSDGSLVRVSTSLRGMDDTLDARMRLRFFESDLLPILRDHWPTERRKPAT